MKLICIRPFGGHVPGDETEVPDGAGYSEWYLAQPGSIAAQRAVADRHAAAVSPAVAAEAAVVAAAKAAVSKPALTPPATPPAKEGA